MHDVSFTGYLVLFMMNTLVLAGVPLGVATLAGLIISFFQAITQIQDQTLSQTIKIVAIVLVMLTLGSVLVAPLAVSTKMIFTEFGEITRH